MRYARPGAVKAAGLICIIYGGVTTFLGLCGTIFLFFQEAFVRNDPAQKHIMNVQIREIPAYHVYVPASVIFGLTVSLILLIGGIGVLGMKRWARKLAIFGAALAIASSVVGAIFSAVFVIPATNKAFEDMPPIMVDNGQGNMAPMPPGLVKGVKFTTIGGQIFALVFSLLFTVLYVVIIWLLTRPHVVEAFNNPVPEDLHERVRDVADQMDDERRDDGYDRDYDDRRRDDRGPPDDRIR